jgi:hypothetical protein
MKKFSQLNIKVSQKGFVGDKIKIQKVINREIVVHHYVINDSKHFKGKCLQLQISINDIMHVLFTGSNGLIEGITQVPDGSFPFQTTIINENERYLFT